MQKRKFVLKGDKDNRAVIMLLEEPYKGVILQYETVRFRRFDPETKKEYENTKLEWTYKLLDCTTYDELTLRNDKVFEQIMGDIILQLIEEEIDPRDGENFWHRFLKKTKGILFDK